MRIEMEVVGVAPEPNSNRPLVWLRDKDQRVFLPIAIGNFEATAIYMELYKEPPPRPITYDLMRSVLDGLGVSVVSVVINALREDTFYAEITLALGEKRLGIDSRPSDAIALALRTGASIYADETVIHEAGLTLVREVELTSDLEGIDEALKSLEAEDGSRGVEGTTDIVEPKVVTLKARLQEAVDREEYEEAARIRDEIGRLEHEDRLG